MKFFWEVFVTMLVITDPPGIEIGRASCRERV